MKKKKASLLVIVLFLLFLFGMAALSLFTEDAAYIVNERRAAEPLPSLSFASLAEGDYSRRLESHLLDTLPFRESFRHLKNRFSHTILHLSDIDGLFLTENGVAKKLSPVDTALIAKNAAFFDRLITTYFPDSAKVYLSLIPDKSYYARPATERSAFDSLARLLDESLTAELCAIPLTDTLSLFSYYATDIHITQQGWFSPLSRLAEAMHFPSPLPEAFDEVPLGAFLGTLGAQAALSDEKDEMTLFYDKSGIVASAEVLYPDGQSGRLYDTSLFAKSDDKYDVFLRGETVGEEGARVGNFFIKVTNPKAESERRLILFRDSFARAALPLFLAAYSEVILVDLRAPSLFYGENAAALFDDGRTDILFLVSAHTLNTTEFR